MNSASAAAVCGLRRYTSVICLCLYLKVNANVKPNGTIEERRAKGDRRESAGR